MPDIFDQIPLAKDNDIFASIPLADKKDGYWDENKIWHPAKKAGELGRKDTVMFDTGDLFEKGYQKVSNLASKLPEGGHILNSLIDFISGGSVQGGLRGAAATLGSIPLNIAEVLKDIVADPTSPALGMAGAARPKAAELEKFISEFPPKTQIPLYEEPKQLPSFFDDSVVERMPSRKFVGAGSESAGQVVPQELAEQDPRKYYDVIGRNADVPAPSVNLDELRESDRLANLDYGPAEQYPGSRIPVTDSGYSMPPESGDTRGGFNPQTSNEMEWPYNVIPNSLRPRAAQTEILSQTGIQGIDFNAPSNNPPNTFSGGIPPEIGGGFEPTPDIALGTGQPTELLQRNSMMPASEIPPKPSLDNVYSAPKAAATPEDINRIPPGQVEPPPINNAGGKDISAFRAEFSSPHVIAENFPHSKTVIDPIMRANDEKYKWLSTIQREFADISKGLDSEGRKALTYTLNGEEVPGISPDILARANRAKNLLDSVWELSNDANPEGVGFIDRYITHIKAQPEDIQSSIKSIIENQFGSESGIAKIFSEGSLRKPTGELGDVLYEKGIGSPTSGFIKTRHGLIQDIETDYDKIMPTYLESMAKVIFDRPAVDAAKEALKTIPQGKLKEYLGAYIKNYTRYDSDAELASAWNSLANQIATTNARSVISFNPVVHMYHAGQLPANVWPELGTKYSMQGARQFLSHPVESYQELAKNGLFSNMIRPMQFQTKIQKFDSVSYFMNMVESIVKGTGYYGFKQKFLDEGMNEAEATMRAIAETKNATATVDPARHMRYFTPESNVLGGQFSRLGKQYHQIPMKLVEQFGRAAANFKSDPAKAARYIAGTAIASAGAGAGLHTLHVNPESLIKYAGGGFGQFGSVMSNVYKNLGKGDVGSALGNIIEWITPGGVSAKKIMIGE